MDTAQLHADSGFFQVNLSNLKRYTRYMAIPVAANDSLVSIYNDPDYEQIPPNVSEIDLFPYGWFGKDTISFWTLPDLASGLTLDTADVTQQEAKLILYVEDMGGKTPDSVGFMWDTADFAGLPAAGDSLPSDDFWTYTDPDSAGFSLSLNGLTRYTEYYFNAYADNLAGRATASANKSFQTLPEVPSLSSVGYDSANDEFLGFVSDLGGDAGLPLPDATGFLWGADADLATFADEAGTFDSNDSTFRASITGLDAGEYYYFASYATNKGGAGYSDTVLIVTPALALTSAEVTGLTDTSFTVAAAFDYESAAPTSVGFVWGTDAALSASSDSTVLMLPDSTATFVIDDAITGTYYYSAFAETAEGNRRYGDTLSFYFPVPLDDNNIQTAVDLWVSDPSTAESTYGHISDWYTGAVTDMEELFFGKSSFNDDISAWDVSQVSNFKNAFRGATAFNQDLGNWDLGAATNTSNMFYEASLFNQNIGDWEMGSVTDLQGMFYKASAFNQDIGDWDVSSVTNSSNVFNQATAFNQDIGAWEVGNVVSMYSMFWKASAFNQYIGGWDVSQVTNFESTFYEASSFNQDIGGWTVVSAKKMNSMFTGASEFNQDLDDWDVSSVTNMSSMFQNATKFRGNVGSWNVSQVTNMSFMFNNIPGYSPNLQNWEVGNVVNMKEMFKLMNSFNSDISDWDVSSVTDMSGMFYSTPFDQDISGWEVGSVKAMREMFRATTSFNQNLENWDVSGVTAMNSMFQSSTSFNQDLGGWDVSGATDMNSMFNNSVLSRENYESTLAGWSELDLSPDVVFGTASKICNTIDREYIKATFDWVITDGGIDTGCPVELPVVLTQAADSMKTAATLNAWLLYDGNSAVSATGFKWGLQPDLSDAQDAVASGQAPAGPVSADLTGLAIETKYYFTAYATNAEGTAFGDTLSFTTVAYPPVVVSNPATDIDYDAGTIRGKVTDDGAYAISATGIKWGLQADLSGAADTTLTMAAADSTFTAALTGLEENTTYYFSAYATNAKGTNFGDTLSFTTPCYQFPSTLQGCDAGALTSLNYQGYDYQLVEINGECWFAENLRSENYNDGTTAIPTGLDNASWWVTTNGAVAVNDEGGANEASNLAQYGRLYNWYAVNTGNLCPSGWHVPSDGEFSALTTYLGDDGDKMKSAVCWEGNNESGFSALAGGSRGFEGEFVNGGSGSSVSFWSSSPDGINAWSRRLVSGYTTVFRSAIQRRYGFSVRCVRDPMVVVSNQVTDLAYSAGTIHGKVLYDGGSSLVATGIKWGLQADLSGAADTTLTMAADSTFTAALTGLDDATTYYFSAYATNAMGTKFGDTLSFTTPCYQFPSTLQGCDAGSLTSMNYQGYDYQLVEINGECWFAENLRNTQFNDGTEIATRLSNSEWSTATVASTVYNEGSENESFFLASYGRLYTYYAVANPSGICPTGWHVPSDAEFTALATFLGGESVAGGKMKSSSCWVDGANESGFSALPGGKRTLTGTFSEGGTSANFWSSTYTTTPAGALFLELKTFNSGIALNNANKRIGLSVRCLRDPMVVETSDATDVGGDTGTLQGKVLHDGGSNLVATGFKWGLQPDLSGAADTVVTMAADSTFSAVLTGLTESTTYYFSAYSTNASGTVHGDTLSFTTPCYQFPSTLQGCDAGALTSLNYQGYDYQLVEIGGQCWFAENLRSENYANGDAISPFDVNNTDLIASTDGIVFNYNGDLANLESYGRLYNWYAANETRGLCPLGWHVPSQNEFDALATYLGGSSEMGGKMKSASCWDGTNESGFSALPGGYVQIFGGILNEGENGHFWTTSSVEVSYPFFGTVTEGLRLRLDLGVPEATTIQSPLREAASVRCVRDDIN